MNSFQKKLSVGGGITAEEKELITKPKKPKRLGYKNPEKHQITCVENGKTYRNQQEAVRDLLLWKSAISQFFRGDLKSVGGYTFTR